MRWLTRLLNDEAGFVLSSELVLVGTVGVVGATVGLNALATAVNGELQDVGFALRSLDQSYAIAGVEGCGAWTAGSTFIQRPVEESHDEMRQQIQRDQAVQEERLKEREEQLRERSGDEERRREPREESREVERRQMERRPEIRREVRPERRPEARPSERRPEESGRRSRERDQEEEVVL